MERGAIRYALGLDSSTQSLTAVVIDYVDGKVVYERSLDYAGDERLNGFGIDRREYLCPPRVPGEADQPPVMYLASLDAMFEDMKNDGFPLRSVAVINVSGQQHGHVYLGAEAQELFGRLREPSSARKPLAIQLARSFAYGTAPIWRTSNTARQASAIRDGAGGRLRMIEISGSDSPLRFTGAVMRRVAEQFPGVFERTEVVQLISSFLPAVLTGNSRVPIDYGNGSGTSLMDYRRREWSRVLLEAAGRGIEGGGEAFRKRLPALERPDAVVGTIASYFTERYGFGPSCRIAAGSGDNPQTKVLVSGDLLSLGTSFVFMVATDGQTFDFEGYANAMYDGLGRPFMFGCRTNGAMVWDRVRAEHGLDKRSYAAAERVLETMEPGASLFLWQPENESFPVSPPFDPIRAGSGNQALAGDYAGIIDSSLAALYWYALGFSGASGEGTPSPRRPDAASPGAASDAAVSGGGSESTATAATLPASGEPLYVTGGATESPQIMRRVSALWRRPVITIGRVGAALGSAVAGVSALQRADGRGAAREQVDVDALSRALLPEASPVFPQAADIRAYHGANGYLRRFVAAYERFVSGAQPA